ncbi:hypothetical protein EDD85DRAFT_752576, partial [Armillaria nabsnona]
ATITEVNGVELLAARLWKSIWHKDISRPVRGFLLKALQNTFKIGPFWKWLGSQYAARGKCSHCKVTESMEHILVECLIKGQATLWNMAQELWEKAG